MINGFDVFPKTDQAFDLDLCLGEERKLEMLSCRHESWQDMWGGVQEFRDG